MAHFAKLDQNNVVINVHVVNNNVLLQDGVEDPQRGIDFLNNLHGNANWVQTSYNDNIRKNFAGIGYTYDSVRDAFIPPKEFNSWTLNEETCRWDPPTPYPDDGNFYYWDEETTSWIQS